MSKRATLASGAVGLVLILAILAADRRPRSDG
jgi:hypothetical protein